MSTCARNAAIYQKVRLALRVIGRVLLTFAPVCKPSLAPVGPLLSSSRSSEVFRPATSVASWSWRATSPSRAWRRRTRSGLARSCRGSADSWSSSLCSSCPSRTCCPPSAPRRPWCPWRSGPEASATPQHADGLQVPKNPTRAILEVKAAENNLLRYGFSVIYSQLHQIAACDDIWPLHNKIYVTVCLCSRIIYAQKV